MSPFHFCLSAASNLNSFQLLPASLITDLLQLFFGLPLFLFPWGFQSRAAFGTFPSSFLNVWPIHLIPPPITQYTEIKLTNIQGFRRICFLLLLGRGLKMEIYQAPAGPKGCQVPHFSRYYNKVKQSCSVTGLEWPRGFQEVKVPRFHDSGTGWW